MLPKSLKTIFIIFMTIVAGQACLLVGDFYVQHLVNQTGSRYQALQEVELLYFEITSLETKVLADASLRDRLEDLYRIMETRSQEIAPPLSGDALAKREQLFARMFDLSEERRRLHRDIERLMPVLVNSVRYIHEHHVAYFKNLLSRGKVEQDYDGEREFARSSIQSASELDIINAAIAIQTNLLDIFESFSALQRERAAPQRDGAFQDKIKQFYASINTFEDYSLDAQDGLLVEELLLNGRLFESAFSRLLTIEEESRQARLDLSSAGSVIHRQLLLARSDAEASFLRLDHRLRVLKLIGLAVNLSMLAALLFYGRQTISALQRTVREAESIQGDLSYRIAMCRDDYAEFRVIFAGLNGMADTIGDQLLQLEAGRNQLEDKVNQRTAELKEVNAKLLQEIEERNRRQQERIELEKRLARAEKMEAIGTLAGGVAHDLNNILSGIINYPELLIMDLPGDDPRRKTLQMIKNSGQKAAGVVQDLLTLARRGTPSQGPVNVNGLIVSFFKGVDWRRIQADHPGMKIESDLAPDLGLVSGSQVHLYKTIMNLVINAAEAMTESGAVIRIRTRNQYVDSPIKGYDKVREGEYVLISVEDNGIGIAEEDLGRIFEPFFTTKSMGRSGTGLGMAVVWGTVRDHAGYIDVASEVGRGTRIQIFLPIDRSLRPVTESRVDMEQFKGQGETVLVVDDIAEQREIASAILGRLGYRVLVAASGEEAVACTRREQVDLVLLDMIMPSGINGLETYRQLLAVQGGIKAVIASGFAETEDVLLAQQLGAGPYIRKPYTYERVGIAIFEELRRA